MQFQLTYGLRDSDEVFVVQLNTTLEEAHFTGAIQDALLYIEKEHGYDSTKNLRGFSVFMP